MASSLQDLMKVGLQFASEGDLLNPSAAYGGSLEKCFKNFVEKVDEQHHRKLAKALGVTWDPTYRDWMRGRLMPKGLNRIKLMYWLERIGYSADEIRGQSGKTARTVGRMAAFEVITEPELTSYVGAAQTKSVYNWILRGHKLMPERFASANELMDAYKEDLTERLTELFGSAEAAYPQSIPVGKLEAVPAAPVPRGTVWLAGEEAAATAGDLVRTLLPLLRYLASDDASVEERIALRESASTGPLMDGGMQELVTLCKQLTSERSRQTFHLGAS